MIHHSKPWITESDIEAVRRTLDSGLVAKGKLAKLFEKKIADYVSCTYAFGASSGTDALKLALKALKISDGDEVILPTYVCNSVLYAVKAVDAVPVLCDVGPDWVMTKEKAESVMTSMTKAIIVVHTMGVYADIDRFKELNVPIIEDACQSFGLNIDGNKSGTKGDIGIFSFHGTKCFTTGEGGMVVTSDQSLADKMSGIIELKQVQSTLSDIQAALGLNQLERYDEMLDRRKSIANYYMENLLDDEIEKTKKIASKSMFFRFPLKSDVDFEELKLFCHNHGVAVRKGVDALLHRMLGLDDSRFPNAVKLFSSTVSLPIYPALSNAESNKVAEVFNLYLSRR